MKKTIVVAIPGIGTKQRHFSVPLENDIRKHAFGDEMLANFQLIELLPFKESSVDFNQKNLYDRIEAENDLGGILSLREFVMHAFGDALTFERDRDRRDSAYKIVHRYLRDEFRKINAILDEHPGSRFVIVAGSLGAHVLSTYIWDADHNIGIFEEHHADRTENLRNLDYLATIGCNIPLFVSGYAPNEIIAIDKRNIHFEWENFYDKHDVLGWPLQQLSPSYRVLVKDIEVNTGLYIGSHIRYWDDNDFTGPFTRKLIELHNTSTALPISGIRPTFGGHEAPLSNN
jgi:hypothetical protein